MGRLLPPRTPATSGVVKGAAQPRSSIGRASPASPWSARLQRISPSSGGRRRRNLRGVVRNMDGQRRQWRLALMLGGGCSGAGTPAPDGRADVIADVSTFDCIRDAHAMDAHDASAGDPVLDAAVSRCMSDDEGVFRSCRHCPVSGQLFGVYCSPASEGPCYLYPTTCVDQGFVDCRNGSMTMRYPGLQERCAAVCVRLRALESTVPCTF